MNVITEQRAQESLCIHDHESAQEMVAFWAERSTAWRNNLDIWVDELNKNPLDPSMVTTYDEQIIVAVKGIARAEQEFQVYTRALELIEIDLGMRVEKIA